MAVVVRTGRAVIIKATIGKRGGGGVYGTTNTDYVMYGPQELQLRLLERAQPVPASSWTRWMNGGCGCGSGWIFCPETLDTCVNKLFGKFTTSLSSHILVYTSYHLLLARSRISSKLIYASCV